MTCRAKYAALSRSAVVAYETFDDENGCCDDHHGHGSGGRLGVPGVDLVPGFVGDLAGELEFGGCRRPEGRVVEQFGKRVSSRLGFVVGMAVTF